jgi:hypothetical protein
MEDSEQYRLTEEAIEQGRRHELNQNHSMRSSEMVQNFIREFEGLPKGESVMSAFYGSAHVALGNYHEALSGGITMASRLKEIYGERLSLAFLRDLIQGTPDILIVNGKEYAARFFGEEDISDVNDFGFVSRAFWRLENAYDDFKNNPLSGDVLPYHNFPMRVEVGQVFVVRYTRADGTYLTMYHRSSGRIWEGFPSTEEFLLAP